MQSNFALSGIVTLLTDFGLADGYASAMKGVLLTRVPGATIVDITHNISRFDKQAALLVLDANFASFPEGTVHVVVVDPEVGSARRHLLVKAEGHIFIGPDNGILGAVAKKYRGEVFEIFPEKMGVSSPSKTFHGRDIYAVAAGELLKRKGAVAFLEPYDNPLMIKIPEPVPVNAGFEGEVIYVDGFGNLITNLRLEHAPDGCDFIANSKKLERVNFYSELPSEGLGMLLDSWGYYEICANQGSAAGLLGFKAGSKVMVFLKKIEESQQ